MRRSPENWELPNPGEVFTLLIESSSTDKLEDGWFSLHVQWILEK